MARTFEERTREKAKEAGEGDRSTGPAYERATKFFEAFSRAVPDGLKPDGIERKDARREESRSRFRDVLDQLLGEGIGQNLDELESLLKDANEINLQQRTDSELLQFIGQTNLIKANASVATLETLITSAVFLDDIATAVEPPSTISISGINDIGNNPEVADVVIPESEDREFPIRKIVLRASRQNKKDIYFGDDDISPEAGFKLSPGESIELDLDFRDDTLYMAGEERTDEVSFMGLI